MVLIIFQQTQLQPIASLQELFNEYLLNGSIEGLEEKLS